MPAKMSATARALHEAELARHEAALAAAAVARVYAVLPDLDPAAAALVREAIGGDLPQEPIQLAGRATVAQWLTEATGMHVAPRVVTDAYARYGYDRTPAEMERTPPPPRANYETLGGNLSLSWDLRSRPAWVDWYLNRPGRTSGLGGRPPKDTTAADAG